MAVKWRTTFPRFCFSSVFVIGWSDLRLQMAIRWQSKSDRTNWQNDIERQKSISYYGPTCFINFEKRNKQATRFKNLYRNYALFQQTVANFNCTFAVLKFKI